MRFCRLCKRTFVPRAMHQKWCSKVCRDRANNSVFRSRHNATYYARYRDKILAYQREYYARNAEKRKEWQREYKARYKALNVAFQPIDDTPTLYD